MVWEVLLSEQFMNWFAMIDQWNRASQWGVENLLVIDSQNFQDCGTHVLWRDRPIDDFTGSLVRFTDRQASF